MKKRSLSCKIVVSMLLFSLILMPVTSSVSFAQTESAAAGGTAAGGTAGLSTAAVVGIAAAVVALGITVAVALDDDDPAASHHATATH